MEYPATAATLDVLPNGLSVILDPDPAAPVVSAQIWVESGSIHEGSLLGSGLSHFLEHMVFKGGGRFGPEELAVNVQAAGGHWNAYTTFDRTVYYIDGPSSGLDAFLEVLAAMVFQPTLPESEFEKEKDVIRREIDMGLDDPDDVASRLLFSSAFVRDPRRHPVIGHRHLFDRIAYEDLTDYHRTRYVPDRCCLCLSGDFDTAVVKARIEELFGSLARGSGAEPLIPADPTQLGPRRGHATFAVPASRISLAWKTPALGHADIPAYDLAAAILGRGRSARLYRGLREEKELALEISAWAWSQPDSEGLFSISAEVEPEKRDALIEAIHAEIGALPSTPLEEDLAKARRQIAASQFKSLTNASGRATDLASNWHEARDLDFTRRYLAELEKVTAEDVRRVIALLQPDHVTLTILDPEGTPPSSASKAAPRRSSEAQSFTLPNGATLALLPDHRVPVIAAQVAVRAGLSSETPATAGINTLLAAALPQGTQTRNAAELAKLLDSLGATLGANSGNNATLVQASGLTPDIGRLLPLLGEVLTQPALPADSIVREKASLAASLKESLEDPVSTAFRLARENLFGPSGYGLNALGSEESLALLGREALVDHHARHFRGPNLALALAGDFDPLEARDLLEQHFGQLPGGEPWTAPASALLAGSEIEARLPKKQAVLALAYPGASALSPQRHALRMIQEWCTDMAGPLFTRIREDLGLAYQVGATQFLGNDTGFFGFYLATDPAQVELAEHELKTEIAQIAQHGIPADAFERVRATVLSSQAIGQQSPGSIARMAALDLLFGLPATHYRDMHRIFSELSHAEVKDAAAQLLQTQPVIVRVLPA